MTWVVALVLLMAAARWAAGLRIRECSEAGWVEIGEDDIAQSSITCERIPENKGVTWTLRSTFTVHRTYTCERERQPCDFGNNQVTVTVTGDASVLTIKSNHRLLAKHGQVTCKALGATEVARCNTNVVRPATVYGCVSRFTYDLQNWTVSASGCRFERAYSSNGTYTVTWYRQREGSISWDYLNTVNVIKTKTTIGGQLYYDGSYSLPTGPLPSGQGKYFYSVDFLPGHVKHYLATITLEPPPESANLSTTCPQYVYEGQGTSCRCMATNAAGTPPPAVLWHGSGPDEDLVIHNVSRSDSGQRFSCQLLWGSPPNHIYRSVTYTLNIAYGPDSVAITDPQTSEEDTVSLTCVATNVQPSADFSWTGVTCQAVTVSTHSSVCSFSPADMEDGDLVTCTAWNSAFPDAVIRKATYNFTLIDFGSPKERRADQKGSDAGIPLDAVIGGLVAGLVLVIVIIIIIVVLVKRRRHRKADSPFPDAQEAARPDSADTGEDAGGYAVINPQAPEPPWADFPGVTGDAGDSADLATNAESHFPPDVPEEYLYAVVDKSQTRTTRGSSSNIQPSDFTVSSSQYANAATGTRPPVDPKPTKVEDSDNLYAQVKKHGKRDQINSLGQPGPEAILGQPGPEAILGQSGMGRERDAPAQVQKPKSAADFSPEPKAKPQVPPKALMKPKPGHDGGKTTEGQSGMETEGYVNAQVQKTRLAGGPKPESKAKPPVQSKPVVKPRPDGDGRKAALQLEDNQYNSEKIDGDNEVITQSGETAARCEEVTQSASTDDEYNTLNFSPRAALPTGDVPNHSLYSHIVGMME